MSISQRPIIMAGESVHGILAGRKTQTRRAISTREPLNYIGPRGEESDPANWGWFFDGPDHNGYMVIGQGFDEHENNGRISIRCPYGEVGDRLWVKERWRTHVHPSDGVNGIRFAADGETVPIENTIEAADRWVIAHDNGKHRGWRSPLFMPRWASRITLEIARVRVQRLQEIDEDDAKAEGVEPFFSRFTQIGRDQCITSGELARDAEHRASYAVTWDEINAARATWKSNPWIRAITFSRVQ